MDDSSFLCKPEEGVLKVMIIINIFRVFEFGTPTIIVADVDVLKQIMVKEFSHFPNRRVGLKLVLY